MDLTALARRLIEPVPAHRSAGLRVLRAADGEGEVALAVEPAWSNVIGSLHSSGLTLLVDAAGLAAIVAAADSEDQFEGVIPLGMTAALEFLAPARGELTASCRLDDVAWQNLQTVLVAAVDRARIATTASVTGPDGTLCCRGTFTWSIRRRR